MRFSFFRPAVPRLAGFPALLTFVLAVMALGVSVPPATAQDGYRIRPGDTLAIEVLQDPTLNRSVLVSPDGRVTFPLAGGVRAAGRTLEQLQADLATQLAPNFAAVPTVFVALEQVAAPREPAEVPMIDLFVMGEAAKPGRLEVRRGTTILQAFAEMGGFTKFAATKRIQLRRGSQTFVIDYTAIERGTSTAGATVLQKGDVILVPQRRLFE